MIDLSQNTTQRQNPGTPSPAADASGPAQAPANSRAGAPDGVAPAVPTARSRSTSWAAYAACAWCIVFAAMSGYWAAGGTLGTDTISGEIKQLPGIVALLWVICVVKLIGGLIALALARPWARALPRRLLLTVAWAAGVGMTLYGGIPLIVNALMLAGLLHVPGPVDWTAIRWHTLLWDPWWLLGGVLFSAAAWSYQRCSRPRRGHGS